MPRRLSARPDATPILPATAAAFAMAIFLVDAITAFLALRNQAANLSLRNQARLLDLTHDTVFVRDMNDVITYWNHGAEELYGWTKEEAIGQVSYRLIQTIFPGPL